MVLSYDPYAPRAISLENHKKKFPYEDCTRRGDKAGKTRTALLEMRTAPQKQCETICCYKARVLVPPKKIKMKNKNGRMIKWLLAE